MSEFLLHGPFWVGPVGDLTVRRPGEHSPELRFAWRGRLCAARLRADALQLAAIAGRVPSTAMRPGDRPRMLEMLARLPGSLPEGWSLRLLPDHRIRLELERPSPRPATATGLVGAMVAFALALDPYLDRLESGGVEEVSEPAETGSAKTWPG
jgi:hypothetical protein